MQTSATRPGRYGDGTQTAFLTRSHKDRQEPRANSASRRSEQFLVVFVALCEFIRVIRAIRGFLPVSPFGCGYAAPGKFVNFVDRCGFAAWRVGGFCF